MIGSTFSQMANAEKLTPQQLQTAIQNGTIPSYIGVPLLQEKMKQAQQAQAMASAQQQQPPTIAEQVMQQAQAQQGVQGLQSNLPTESMAGGGIVAFANGGMYDEEDEDEDRLDAERQAEMSDLMNEYAQTFQQGIGQLPAAQPQAREAPAQTQGREENSGADITDLIAKIQHRESRGRQYGKDGNLLTSSKGAESSMQVMPKTQTDPGFGVAPARDRSANEIDRVGRDYAAALLERYGDPKLAAIAYNMGPGATDKWLAAGADMSKLPKETQGYVKGFAGGGEVQHFAAGGQGVDPELMSQIDIIGSQLDEARKELEKTPRPGQRQILADPDSLTRYQAAKARKDALELGYQNIMGSTGLDQAAFGVYRGALGTKKPEANPWVQAMSTPQAPAVRQNLAPAGPQGQATNNAPMRANPQDEFQGLLSGTDIEGMGSSPMNMGAPMAAATQQSAAPVERPLSKLEQYQQALTDSIEKREENIARQREQDRAMALLSAGLGIMGGQSPRALANIGAGAQQGIQSLAASNKDRTAEENALLSGKLNLLKLGTSAEQAEAIRNLRGDLQKNVLDQRDAQAKAALEEKVQTRTLREQEYAMKRLADISKNAEIQAEKAISANPALNFAADRESKKQSMIADILRRSSVYAKTYQSAYGKDADPFEGLGQLGGGGKGSYDYSKADKILGGK